MGELLLMTGTWRRVAKALLVVATALSFLTAQAGEPAALPTDATAAELLAFGDRSARERRYSEALTAWKQAFERRFSGFRGVPFIYPVEAAFLDREGLRAKLLEEFKKEMPDEKLLAMQKAMAAFGFFSPKLDLKRTLLDVLTEEIGGFYDPDTKRLYLIQEGKPEGERRWWEKLLGTGTGFDPEEQKMVLVHEMSHALMDQHHDLFSMHRSVEADDDASLALSALIEGEATVCMLLPSLGKDFLQSPPGFLDPYLNFITPFLSFAAGASYRRAPRILKETLLFPYFRGMGFCLSLTSEEGAWAPVDRAFSEPPTSTEQVLHPEKYPSDAPTALSFPELLRPLGSGWSAVLANVLGEFQIRVLLSEKLAARESENAAEGWDGDFYRVYERAGGAEPEILLVWASTWDSEDEASEFAEALKKFQSARRGAEAEAQSVPRLPREASSWSWRAGDRVSAVIHRRSDVWLLDGVPDDRLARVARAAMRIERQEKTFELRRFKPSVSFPEEKRIRAKRL